MRINNNISAINTHRQYSINNSAIAKSTEKLSSGYRINRAGDDAAGLAISEKMRAQIRGLNMASKNSQDAISLVQTAEGALQESHNILQRMRELAVQSASDTNETAIDRAALELEFQQLIAELDDIASKTRFNDQNIIDGTFQELKSILTDATGFADVANTYFASKAASGTYSFLASTSVSRTLVTAGVAPTAELSDGLTGKAVSGFSFTIDTNIDLALNGDFTDGNDYDTTFTTSRSADGKLDITMSIDSDNRTHISSSTLDLSDLDLTVDQDVEISLGNGISMTVHILGRDDNTLDSVYQLIEDELAKITELEITEVSAATTAAPATAPGLAFTDGDFNNTVTQGISAYTLSNIDSEIGASLNGATGQLTLTSIDNDGQNAIFTLTFDNGVTFTGTGDLSGAGPYSITLTNSDGHTIDLDLTGAYTGSAASDVAALQTAFSTYGEVTVTNGTAATEAKGQVLSAAYTTTSEVTLADFTSGVDVGVGTHYNERFEITASATNAGDFELQVNNDYITVDGGIFANALATGTLYLDLGGRVGMIELDIDTTALTSANDIAVALAEFLDGQVIEYLGGVNPTYAEENVANVAVTNANGTTEALVLRAGDTEITTSSGITITLDQALTAADLASDAALTAILGSLSATVTIGQEAGKNMVIQTGANEGDELSINIDQMNAWHLGVDKSSIATREAASKAITETNDAINQVSMQRAHLGALQNRLTHKIANLDTSAENLQAAESRIRDVDMAKEMSEYTRAQILQQASIAMLAQANSAPQGVLQLLG